MPKELVNTWYIGLQEFRPKEVNGGLIILALEKEMVWKQLFNNVGFTRDFGLVILDL